MSSTAVAGEPPRARAATGRRRRIVALAATALLAAALSALFQRPGLVLGPDGWAYWEGSVSLLRGDGYRYFGGQPITLWPPLFPLWLAAAQALGGSLAGTVAVAQAVALGAAAALWGRLALPDEGVDGASLLALPALAGLLAFSHRELTSESLYMALLGAALGVALGDSRRRWWALAALLGALLLTRNAALALVPGVLLVAVLVEPGARRRAIGRAVAAGAGAVVVWFGVRAALGQAGSHPVAAPEPARFAAVAEGMLGRLVEVAGPGVLRLGAILLAGHVLLALGLWGAARGEEPDRPARTAALLALFGLVALFAFVLLVPVASPLETRFGRFALAVSPLFVLVPVLAVRSGGLRSLRALAALLLVATVAVQLRRAVYWGAAVYEAPVVEGLAWSECLDPEGAAAGCAEPPDYDWIDRGRGAPGRGGAD